MYHWTSFSPAADYGCIFVRTLLTDNWVIFPEVEIAHPPADMNLRASKYICNWPHIWAEPPA